MGKAYALLDLLSGSADTPAPSRSPSPSALSRLERQRVLDLLNSPAYAELASAQVWARESDEQRYWCSVSTMYRILREVGQLGERRAQTTHPARKLDEVLIADAAARERVDLEGL